MCVFVCVWGESVTMITRNCVHFQLIKFWPSRGPGKVYGRANFFGSALLQLARSVCVSSERFLLRDAIA